MLNQVLKSLWIETRHTQYVRKYRIRGFGRSAMLHTFSRVPDTTENEQPQSQSVFDYFWERYTIRLNYPDLPTVGKMIPSRLFSIIEIYS